MTKQGKRDPEIDNNNNKLLDTLTKHIDGLDNLVVNKTSINTIKKSLVQATMFSNCIILGSWLLFGAIEYNCGVLVPCTFALLYFSMCHNVVAWSGSQDSQASQPKAGPDEAARLRVA